MARIIATPSLGQGSLGAAPASNFPLSIHSSGRYFIDRTGAPFPIWGDSMWWGPQNLGISDQIQYLTNRIGLGFTAVLLNPFEHDGCKNKPPLDFYSALPFTKRLDGSSYTGSPNGCAASSGTGYPDGSSGNQFAADPYAGSGANVIANAAPDFTYPNAIYWAQILAFVQLCDSRGLECVLFASYVGYAAGDQGWMNEMVANDAVTGAGGQAGQPYADGSKSKMWNFGAWQANYFKNFPNILWIQGGDYGSGGGSGTFSTPQKTAVSNTLAGMRSVSGQLSGLHGAHWSRPALASDVTLSAGSLDIETVYTDNTPAAEMRSGYAHTPAAPTFQIEGRYEGDATGSAPFRQYNWWCTTSGGGYFYGNASTYNGNSSGGMYEFLAGWQGALNSQCSLDMGRMHAFLRAIPWWKLVPSSSFVTANGSSSGNSDYVSAAVASDNTIAIAYVPPAWANTTFTVDMTQLAATTTAWWFDPTNGAHTLISSSLANTGTHTFTPPGSNAGGQSDQVLLMKCG